MRWIIRSLFALLLLLVLAVGAVFLIPAEKIAGLAVGKFKTLTGRDLQIEGSVRPSFWPVLGVTTGRVTISNADWSKEGPMFQAESLDIAVDMAALVGGEVKINGVSAVSPVLVLEKAKDGRANWVFGGDNGGTITTDTPGVGQSFTLGKATVTEGRLIYIDHATGQREEIDKIALETAIPDFEGSVALDLKGSRKGQPFDLALKLGAFRAFLDGGLGPVEAQLATGGAEVEFKGDAGWNPMAAKGDVVADLDDLQAISALAGVPRPALPKGLGAGSVKLSGGITLTDAGSVHLRGASVGLDETQLALDADLTQGEARPKLVAKVRAGGLDLRGLTGEGGGSGGGMGAGGWPKERIDVSALGLMDADVALTADTVDVAGIRLGAVAVKLTIDRARAVFDIRKVAAYGGGIAGQFVVNGRKGLSVGGDLGFSDMDLQSLMRDFAGYERLVGRGDLRLKFLGVGNSVDEIMQGLEGSGSLALGKGEILGLDIGGMLRTLDTGYVGEGQKTIFNALSGSFTIAGGVLENDDLVMTSRHVDLIGKGMIGLGKRNLNYRLKATALADDQGQGGLTAPLLIKGPWADPKFTLDLEALAQERLDEEKAALEAKAKEKAAALEAEARAKLEAELGVVQQEGESIEDAIKRRGEEVITDEAAKALEKLLGGGN